ncbi:MAG: hypothetical protein MRZ79_15845 [Bacteroidia bacterium]|nr:hypothetical protein [Bacteroidia bacterium]
MSSRLRNILGLIVGLIIAFGTIMLIEGLGHQIFPPSEEILAAQGKLSKLDPQDREGRKEAMDAMQQAMADYLESAPFGAVEIILLAWLLAALFGSFVATTLTASHKLRYGLSIGGAVLLMTILNFVMIPYHPIWVILLVVLLIPLFAWLGAKASLFFFPSTKSAS